jgi:hypothetical protein
MAIAGKQVASSSTLNTLRTEFNNLVTDVAAIEGGSITYTTLNTTTTNATTLNVKEDGTIVFEGATDDDYETTLTVVDPTADRTITFPNETGTVHTSGGTTTHTAIVVADGGNIGSASDTDAIGISSGGVVSVSATTANTSATDGALTVAGGLGVAADASIGDDLRLISDSAVLSFGADSDTTLTHTDGTGLTLNSTNKLTFGDAASFIHQGADSMLVIEGEAIIDMNASTRVDISTDLVVGNDIHLDSDSAVLGFGDDKEITLTHVHDVGLTLTNAHTTDDKPIVLNLKNEEDALIADEEIGRIDFTAGDSDGTDAILTAASIAAVAEDTFAADNNSTGLAFKLGVSAAATEMFRMDHDGDFKVLTDGSAIAFGANNEIELTHVHDTGLLLTDSGGSPTLQFHDANESVSSDGSKLILTSNGTAFNLPTSDGTSGQALITDGSGTFSFTTVSANTPSSADGQALGSASLEWSDLFLADGGTVTFGNDQEIVLAHVADTGLTLKHASSSDDSAPTFTLQTGDTDIAANDLLGSLHFQAPDEGAGTDAVLVAAGIDALSEGDFSSSNNATRLRFLTAASETASEKMSLSSTGVLTLNGGSGSIVIPDGGNIGSDSDTNAIGISSGGVVSITATTANTSASDGALTVAGGLGVAADASIGDDLRLISDSAVLSFGADGDITLTHVHNSGLTLTNNQETDDLPVVFTLKSEEDAIIANEEIGRIDFKAGDSDGTDAILTAASIAAIAEDTFAADNNSTGLGFKLGVSAAATEMFRMTHDGDFKIKTDGSAVGFGADNEIELTHVHNTGLLLTDSGGSPTLQLHDSNESIASDGSKVIITSGGTAFSLPTSDGSNGQALGTNGSGVLSFIDAGSSVAYNAYEYTATASQTSFSGSDDNSNTLAYTAGVNYVQVYVNGVLLDSSDYTATNGTAVVLGAGAAVNDMVKINAVQVTSVQSADMDGAELVLDADGDTSIRANTDDQIDFKLGNAIDITMGANAMNILSGTTLTIDSGATITNSGTANGFGLSTGKAIVLSMLFGR